MLCFNILNILLKKILNAKYKYSKQENVKKTQKTKKQKPTTYFSDHTQVCQVRTCSLVLLLHLFLCWNQYQKPGQGMKLKIKQIILEANFCLCNFRAQNWQAAGNALAQDFKESRCTVLLSKRQVKKINTNRSENSVAFWNAFLDLKPL